MKTTLSQNEINSRSARFAQNWKDTIREEADAQAFLIDFGSVPPNRRGLTDKANQQKKSFPIRE